MRRILFVSVLIIISVTKNYGNVHIEITSQNETTLNEQEVDSIIGDWVISASVWVETKHKKATLIKTESAVNCNVCPIIIFKKNGKGIIEKADKSRSAFNWFISKEKIYFTFDKKKDEKEFFSSDKEFRFKIYRGSKFYHLELIQKKEGYKYILLRTFE